MAKFAKGAKVQQVVKPIKGEVLDFSVDRESGDLQMLVGWTDEEGQYHEKFFKESEVEAQPE